jgi:CHAT domain-containing protein
MACLVTATTSLWTSSSVSAHLIVTSAKSTTANEAPLFSPDDVLERVLLGDGNATSLDTMFEWQHFEYELLPRALGAVVIEGKRAGSHFTWIMHEGQCVVIVKAQGSSRDKPADLRRMEEMLAQLEVAKELQDWETIERKLVPTLELAQSLQQTEAVGISYFIGAEAAFANGLQANVQKRVGSALDIVGENLLRARVLTVKARASRTAEDYASAESTIKDAQKITDRLAPDSAVNAAVLIELAEILASAGRPAEAAAIVERALAILEKRCGKCRATAVALGVQANVLNLLDRSKDGLAVALDGIAILRTLESDTPEVAKQLVQLAGLCGWDLNPPPACADHPLAQGLAIFKHLPNPGIEYAYALLARGNAAARKNDISATRESWLAALAEFRRLQPGGSGEAGALTNLGYLTYEVDGDLDQARDYLIRARDIQLRLRPQSLSMSAVYHHLARVAELRGDFDDADAEYARSISIKKALNKNGRSLAIEWIARGTMLVKAGRLHAAEPCFDEAITIAKKLPDGARQIAANSSELGWFELAKGAPQIALVRFSSAVSYFSKVMPSGLEEARARFGIGQSRFALGEFAFAKKELGRARKTYFEKAPDSLDNAEVLHALAKTEDQLGETNAARDDYCHASEILDRASTRVGGHIAKSQFREQYSEVFQDCMKARLQEGDVIGAFNALERSRAYALRTALEQRQLNFEGRAPKSILDALHTNSLNYEEAFQQLSQANAAGSAVPEAALSDIRKTRAGLESDLMRVAPAVAGLLFPVVPGGDSLIAAMPAGTTALTFAVGDKETILFVATDQGIRVVRLRVTRDQLTKDISGFRELIEQRDVAKFKPLIAGAEALYALLIEPAASELKGTKRLIVSPEGPLSDLPFAALLDRKTHRYLIEDFSIGIIDSWSVQKSLSERTGSLHRLLAIADPTLPLFASTNSSMDSSTLQDLRSLEQLPSARNEVDAIARLNFAEAETLVGDEATESRVEHDALSSGVIHFATHTLFNTQRPLESAIVLRVDAAAASAEDDGLLHVWEIFERFNLEGDLVVLSSCETARGKELRGEGLVGFTRAFQFAGARSVVASLWKVQDASTADLMEKFYSARAESRSDIEALRVAIVSQIRGDNTRPQTVERGVGGLARPAAMKAVHAHPYYWAAFQFYGDGG